MSTDSIIKIDVTPTEQEKLWVKALASGEKANKIAEDFGMNRNTFAYHLRFLRAKFQCKNTNQLISYFLRNNLID
jgi:DNA-binding CsgD family transcriptional regulator